MENHDEDSALCDDFEDSSDSEFSVDNNEKPNIHEVQPIKRIFFTSNKINQRTLFMQIVYFLYIEKYFICMYLKSKFGKVCFYLKSLVLNLTYIYIL